MDDDVLPTLDNDPQFVLEGFKVSVAMELTRVMKADGVTPEALAALLGWSVDRVRGVMTHSMKDGFTLKDLAKIATALGYDPRIVLEEPAKTQDKKGVSE